MRSGGSGQRKGRNQEDGLTGKGQDAVAVSVDTGHHHWLLGAAVPPQPAQLLLLGVPPSRPKSMVGISHRLNLGHPQTSSCPAAENESGPFKLSWKRQGLPVPTTPPVAHS